MAEIVSGWKIDKINQVFPNQPISISLINQWQ